MIRRAEALARRDRRLPASIRGRRSRTCPLLALILVGAWESHAVVPAFAGHPPNTAIRLIAEPAVSATEITLVTRWLQGDRAVIDRDFGVTARPLLTVHLFATQQAFARVLHRTQGVWPQSVQDSDGNIVHGILPLGPPNALLQHNLAHIYTEWVLDRLTGNASDRQPAPAWLYDGIAEWEANRRGSASVCHVHLPYPLPLSQLSAPQAWWRIRGTPFGSLAYCEAGNAVRRLIARIGISAMVQRLHRYHSWRAFAASLSL